MSKESKKNLLLLLIFILALSTYVILPVYVNADEEVVEEQQEYTVKYDGNGATSGEMKDDTCIFEKVCSLTENYFVKTGYIFIGWDTKEDGSGDYYKDKAEYSNLDDLKEVTLYAQWKKLGYTITYYLNGGVNNSKNPVDYYNLKSDIKLLNPTRTGYAFNGWYSDAKLTKKVTSIPKGSKGNKVLYAKWTRTKYTVKYNLNGGSGSNPTSYYVNSATITLKNPTKKGYLFDGWYSDAKFTTEKVLTIPKGSVGNKVLYAKWIKVKYNITYNLNGGVNSTSNPTNYYVTSSTITLKNPARKGYTFSGWYSDAKLTKKVKSIAKGSVGNRVLYAKWTANKYTIKFNGNGATSGKMASMTNRLYDKSYTLTALGFKRTGYLFVEWNTKADGTGYSFTNKQVIKNITSKNGTTVNLYAIWKKATYTITYELDGGTNSTSNPALYNITTATITFKNPTKDGFVFKGWYSDAKFTKKVTSISKGSVGNRVLYAKWQLVGYSIKYNLDGGVNNPSNPVGYGISTPTITFKEPTKKGYEFEGWFSDEDLTKPITTIEQGSKGNVVIYANWTPISYTVNLHNNVPGVEDKYTTNSMVYDIGQALKVGYENGGLKVVAWNTKADGTGTSYSSTKSVKNILSTEGATIDLYAVWGVNTPSAKAETMRFDKILIYIDSDEGNGLELYSSLSAKGTYTKMYDSQDDILVHKELDESTTYYYKVRAYAYDNENNKVYSDYSTVVSAKTSAKPNIEAEFVTFEETDEVTGLVVSNNGSKNLTIYYDSVLISESSESDTLYESSFYDTKGNYISKNIVLKPNKTISMYAALDDGDIILNLSNDTAYISFLLDYDGITYIVSALADGRYGYGAYNTYEDYDNDIIAGIVQ